MINMSRDRKIHILRYASAISGSFTSIGIAAMIAWTSPALPYLSNKSKTPLSKSEIYWIAPLLNVGCLIGYLLNPLIIDNFGRKRTLLIYSIPQILSWILIIISENYLFIYLGRILGGIGYGAGSCALTIYLSEIGNQNNRGIFLVFLKLTRSIGSFFTMLLGAYCSYNLMNEILLIIPLIFIFTFLFMPDTIYFHEKNQKNEEEIKLNNVNNIDLNYINKIKNNQFNESKLKIINKENNDKKEFKLKKLFLLSNNRKALIIINCLIIQNVFSGNTITRVFAQQILTYDNSFLQPEKAAYLFAGFSIINSLISTITIERFKRKKLSLLLGILASISHLIMGLYFFLKNLNFHVSLFNWLPLLGLIIYDFSIINGNIIIISIYEGTLFPKDVKSIGITFSKVIFMILSFLAQLLFQLLNEIFDIFVIFWIFAFWSAIMTWILFLITPETKGKSLDEIQILLKSRKI